MDKFFRVMKRILCVIGCTLVAVIIAGVLLYVAMVIDTNSVKREIEATVKGEIPYTEINEHLKFHAYHFSERYEDENIGNIHVKVKREFVLHNWKEGYMWVLTDIHVDDVDGEIIRGGQDGSVFKIQKIDGKWVVVDRKPAMKTFAEVTVPW